jgi:HSP20 family protein
MFGNNLSRQGFWAPFRELDRLREEMSRIFGGPQNGEIRPTAEFPAMNVWTGEESVVVTAELPGVEAGALDVSAVADTLTIKGERKPLELAEGELYHRQERSSGSFVRTVQLPFRVDPDQIEAKFQRGVLRVELKRPEEERPRKITVKAG